MNTKAKAKATRIKKPRGFRPAGIIDWCSFARNEPPFLRAPGRRSAARNRGITYERKMHEHFQALYGERYIASPWLIFKSGGEGKLRWCQPDALLFDFRSGTVTIIEYKYQHTSQAWWQLSMLYGPLIAELFPDTLWTVKLVEVVKWYDPDKPFPGRTKLVHDLEAPTENAIGVHICNPSRLA